MADKAEPFKFTTNVPVPCEIRFVDIRPGKLWTDTKGVTKKLPAQVSVKGKFGSVDTICFLPGPAWKNVKSLAAGGVIAEEPALSAANDEGLEAVVACPVLHGKVTMTLAKPAGERYESFVVDSGKVAPQGEGRVASPYVKPSGPSKGNLPFDEESFPSQEYGESIHGAEGNDEGAYADPRPLPAFHKPPQTKAAETAPLAAKKAALFDEYMSLTGLVRKHSGHTSDEAIQATTFSIFKMWKDGGLV